MRLPLVAKQNQDPAIMATVAVVTGCGRARLYRATNLASEFHNILCHQPPRALTLGLPLVLVQVGIMAMAVGDTVMVGHLSPQTLGGVTVGNLHFQRPAVMREADLVLRDRSLYGVLELVCPTA